MGLSRYHKRSYRPYQNRRRIFVGIGVAAAVVLLIAGAAIYTLLTRDTGSEPVEETSAVDMQKADDASLLVVVNRQNPLSADYKPSLREYRGLYVNPVLLSDLRALIKDAEAQGVKLTVKTAYRSYEEQQALYEKTLNDYLKSGQYSEVRAEAEAQKHVPKAGCSEAQLGLLLEFDVSDSSAKAFLQRSCVNYGFIPRYPEGKDELTHRAPDDSLYRYVGRDNAVRIRSLDMCLEEYYNYINKE